ncbi:helix-turn-helix domain-containing protein [Luteibacter aegosomatissinici]|uniref:helix-turn-helix domain-containing protein n=1 Tax=Luteibacter aegosomatissinici TaxID=2911539 RepID=UPI001FFB79CD|nr:helix-turn-helix domain-containing protein [Luteibacter aegosomatissinici]UPG96553.1 helix-turn-helix domain-containing protein [Luteibacter aegosomatissinici]
MSYIRDMITPDPILQPLRDLGQMLKDARTRMGMTQAAVAHAAGVGRQKLIEVEQGKPSVAMGTYAAVMRALNLIPTAGEPLVAIDEFPQLKRLAWNRPGKRTIPEPDALALYERNWDLVDRNEMNDKERRLLDDLVNRYGNGVLHV